MVEHTGLPPAQVPPPFSHNCSLGWSLCVRSQTSPLRLHPASRTSVPMSCRLYHITLWTFLLALGHFLSELFVFGTAAPTIGVLAPLMVASKHPSTPDLPWEMPPLGWGRRDRHTRVSESAVPTSATDLFSVFKVSRSWVC